MIKLRINALVSLAAVMCKGVRQKCMEFKPLISCRITPVSGGPGGVFMLQILIRASPLEADQGLQQPKPHVLVEFISVVRLA